MSFIKKIQDKIFSWSSIFYKKRVVNKSTKISEKTDVKKNTINEITLEQKKERKKIITETKGKTNRVTQLSPEQEKLIAKKYDVKNRKKQKLSVFNIEKLDYEVELLNTNLELHRAEEFNLLNISSESIANLKKDLIKNKPVQVTISNTLLENRKIIKNFREREKKQIDVKRQDLSKFSLIELFKEREKVKELARIETQKKEEKRVKNLKFDKIISEVKMLIENYDFDKAEVELNQALSLNSSRHKVVYNLRNEILKLKSHFEKQQAKFKQVFDKANSQMINKDYENALKNFNQSKLYGIQGEEVDEKISLIKEHIHAKNIIEEKFIMEKERFFVDIQNKSFIKAKRRLTAISENFEDNVLEIEGFQKLFDESKLAHNKVKNNYKNDIQKAEAYFLSENFNEAISVFKNCLSLNIDNKFCEKRINEIEFKQKTDLKRKELLIKKGKQEKRRIATLNKFKTEKEEILQFLRSKGIRYFYHFTDESNISSIKLNGGLYSWFFCENNGIEINKPGGNSTSRNLDQKYNIENFVRLSFVEDHPMKFVALKENRLRKIRNLEIDIETATFKNTLFSDMNATKNNHKKGGNVSFLKNEIKFDVIKEPKYYNLCLEDKPYYQAEILVEQHLESKYITNL